ncbi:MAG: hypothetical protein E5X42_30320, partial [Mesorhizobium sp.]
MTAIEDRSPFRRSRDIAAYFELTSRRRQSGSTIDGSSRRPATGTLGARSTSGVKFDHALQG